MTLKIKIKRNKIKCKKLSSSLNFFLRKLLLVIQFALTFTITTQSKTIKYKLLSTAKQFQYAYLQILEDFFEITIRLSTATRRFELNMKFVFAYVFCHFVREVFAMIRFNNRYDNTTLSFKNTRKTRYFSMMLFHNPTVHFDLCDFIADFQTSVDKQRIGFFLMDV